MIGYCCKYTPVELLTALGGKPVLLDGQVQDFETAESLTHSNLCCHAKAMIQHGLEMEELVVMDCCDSVRKAEDIFASQGKQRFLRLMELPHDNGQCAVKRFQKSLMELVGDYSAHTGQAFDRDVFLTECRKNSGCPEQNRPWIAVLGARVPPAVLTQIEQELNLSVVNLTCSGNRYLELPPEDAITMELDDLMGWYAGALLGMMPCMRMMNPASRRSITEDPMLRGIVYNTVKFCDYYGFEYSSLKSHTSVPILKIESDYMPMPSGQLKTRLEAFSETLGLQAPRRNHMSLNTEKPGLYAGIDSGSTTTNMVVINEKREILASAIVRTGAKAQNGAKAALDAVCRQLDAQPGDFAAIMATGYGRSNIPFATDTKTEITCHAKGAFFLNPKTRTIVDIGGQDSKVICLDEEGAVTNFIMNDKCAAGTGRFLEMMARTLEVDMEEMSRRGLKWNNDLTISSMCTVFAESEVISLIADNHSEADIIHGLNKSIAAKTASMVARAKGEGPYMMTGGVARNLGVVRELENRLKAPLYIADEPDLCGALGAALLALEE